MTQEGKKAITWIEELLSTEKKQGRGKLGDEEVGFCCLGLGCNVLGIEHDTWAGQNKEFMEEVGLYGDQGQSRGSIYFPSHPSLITLNDNNKKSFKFIGEHLIKHPRAYFIDSVANEVNEYFSKK